tara:strand:- start:1129 stop:1389 length:261 start_codon:yes stop_codon:yes gene_type:complete
MTLSKYLKESLYKARLSQAKFAKKIGCTPSAVSLWLSGKRIPQLQLLEKISFVLAEQKKTDQQKELALLVAALLNDLREGRKHVGG